MEDTRGLWCQYREGSRRVSGSEYRERVGGTKGGRVSWCVHTGYDVRCTIHADAGVMCSISCVLCRVMG
jgi:hypothetical protein